MDSSQRTKALILNDFRIRFSDLDASIYLEVKGGEGAHVSIHPGVGRDAVVIHFKAKESLTAEVLAPIRHADLKDLWTAVGDEVVAAALTVLEEHIVGPIHFKHRKWKRCRAMALDGIPDDALQSLTDKFAPVGPDFYKRYLARRPDFDQLEQLSGGALVQQLLPLTCAPAQCHAPLGILFAPDWSFAVKFLRIGGRVYFFGESADLMARLQAAVLPILEAHPVGERLVQVLIALPDWIQAKLEVSGASDHE